MLIKAIEHYRQVVNDFPGSQEADNAARHAATLEGELAAKPMK